MNKELKQLEKQLTEMVENFIYHDYKKNAEKELLEIENKTKKATSHIRFIVNNYPDFNHIELKFTQPGIFVMKLCINPEVLKNDPKSIKKLVKMFKGWLKKGRIE